MNRLLSILVAIFVLFLLYIWINHLISKPDESSVKITSDYNYEENYLSEQRSDDGYALSNYEGKKHIQENKTDESSPAVMEEMEAEVSDKEESPAIVEEKPVPPPAAQKKTENYDGEHLVIAGNFIDRANAQKRADELKTLGFPHAEVVNFELSEYHTVCAGRFSDVNEARRTARKIKESHNIDSYVRNGNKP